MESSDCHFFFLLPVLPKSTKDDRFLLKFRVTKIVGGRPSNQDPRVCWWHPSLVLLSLGSGSLAVDVCDQWRTTPDEAEVVMMERKADLHNSTCCRWDCTCCDKESNYECFLLGDAPAQVQLMRCAADMPATVPEFHTYNTIVIWANSLFTGS